MHVLFNQKQNAGAGGVADYQNGAAMQVDSNSTAAMATLNILNNPNVVAAIVSAATGAASNSPVAPNYSHSSVSLSLCLYAVFGDPHICAH